MRLDGSGSGEEEDEEIAKSRWKSIGFGRRRRVADGAVSSDNSRSDEMSFVLDVQTQTQKRKRESRISLASVQFAY